MNGWIYGVIGLTAAGILGMIAGCDCAGEDESSSSDVPPEASGAESDAPREALKAELAEDSSVHLEDTSFSRRDIGIEGWNFFRVSQRVADAVTKTYVVRDDGTIVDKAYFGAGRGDDGEVDEAEAKGLEELFEDMELLERDEIPTERVLSAAAFLVGGGTDIVTSEIGPSSQQLDSARERHGDEIDVELEDPRIERQDDRLVIRYFAQSFAPPSGVVGLHRYEIEVDPDYSVTALRETLDMTYR